MISFPSSLSLITEEEEEGRAYDFPNPLYSILTSLASFDPPIDRIDNDFVQYYYLSLFSPPNRESFR